MDTPLNSALHSSLSGNMSSLPQFGGFLPSQLANLELWTRYNQGITETGSGVSQWDDQSGNGNHLKQATGTNQPTMQADGSILFDGVDNYLVADAFTLVQPETIYLLFKQVTWTGNDYIFDGNSAEGGVLRQQPAGASPQLAIYAGTALATNSDLTLDTYGVAAVVFNGASSVLQVDNGTPLEGAAGAANMGGFTLGRRATAANFSNIQVKEALIYSVAHDAATRAQVITYLQGI